MALNDGVTYYFSGQDTNADPVGGVIPALVGNAVATAEGFSIPAQTDSVDVDIASIGTGDFSFLFWHKRTGASPTDFDYMGNRPLAADGAAAGWAFGSLGTHGDTSFLADTGGSGFAKSSNNTTYLDIDTWYALCGTIRRATNDIRSWRWSSGGSPSEPSITVTPPNALDFTGPSTVKLGGRPGTTDRTLIGIIGDLRFYDRAISWDEFLDFHAADPFGITAPSQPPAGPPPVHPLSGFSHPLGRPSGSRSSFHDIEQG